MWRLCTAFTKRRSPPAWPVVETMDWDGSRGVTAEQSARPAVNMRITVGGRLDQGPDAPLSSVGRDHVVLLAAVSHGGTRAIALVQFLDEPVAQYQDPYWVYFLHDNLAIPYDSHQLADRAEAYKMAAECIAYDQENQ